MVHLRAAAQVKGPVQTVFLLFPPNPEGDPNTKFWELVETPFFSLPLPSPPAVTPTLLQASLSPFLYLFLFAGAQCSLSASKESFLHVGGDPDGPDGILEGSWLQRKAPGLITIFLCQGDCFFWWCPQSSLWPKFKSLCKCRKQIMPFGIFFFLSNLPFSSFPAFPLGENENLSSCFSWEASFRT